MANITLNGRVVEAAEGAPLLEVIKDNGVYISNLCYIDGLPPYAGCRTCLVEVEGARGLQLSCTSTVRDGMVVRTDTDEVFDARRQVMSIIMANHPDRCLTCHRTVHCQPGDICLRDDIVTHRCLTCSKNYRCELQTATEMVQMAKFEPWVGEQRSYYQLPELPPADRGNPYLEFDPQMCIICTRCVRACGELRHTNAITLSGRGFTTEIAFGSGGAIDESSCDFCGACIDVCPVAALMEHPNKWIGHTNNWVETTCGSCSVGCSIKLGVRGGKGVIVRPDTIANPVSSDQICVRGRFGYDAVKQRDRLGRPAVRKGLTQTPVAWNDAIDDVATRLAQIRREHGPGSIAVLGSALSTTEESYLLAKLARVALGTNNVDHSLGPVADAVGGALRDAFGSEVLPADLLDLATADLIIAVGADIEESHPVASLRIKDAVVRNGARLITVTPRRGVLDDFARVKIEPRAGGAPHALASLFERLLADESLARRAEALGGRPEVAGGESGANDDDLGAAAALLAEAAGQAKMKLAIVYAPPHLGPDEAGAVARLLANIALVCREQDAGGALHLLGPEVNIVGMRDAGLAPGLLPGYRRVESEPDRRAVAEIWHAEPPASRGLAFNEAMAAAKEGRLKAMLVVRDNPMMLAPDTAWVGEALGALDYLVVVDELLTDTAKLAHAVLPEAGLYGRDGTFTSADRRVLRQRAAVQPHGEARPAWRIIASLGAALCEKLDVRDASFNYAAASDVMDELALLVPLYGGALYSGLISGERQHFPEGVAATGRLQPAAPKALATPAPGEMALLTGRTHFTSYEAAAIHSPEADQLHREEFVEINPADAAALGVDEGAEVRLASDRGELVIRARLSERVAQGSAFVPLYYDGGAVLRLIGREGDAAGATPVRISAAVPA